MKPRCAGRRLPLPQGWKRNVKLAVVQAISLASVALTIARSQAAGGDRERRLQGQVDAADTEIALLREELSIKDARWSRLHSRRCPHYTPIQRVPSVSVHEIVGAVRLSSDVRDVAGGPQHSRGKSTRRSLKTSNCLESVNALVEERCAKVDHWKNSSQRQRWLATALEDIDPRLRKVMGYRQLPKLREALKQELKIEERRSTKSKSKVA